MPLIYKIKADTFVNDNMKIYSYQLIKIDMCTTWEEKKDQWEVSNNYVAECEGYTDDKTCLFSNASLFSCPFNLKFRKVGKNLKGKLFSPIRFAFISLEKTDTTAVVSVTNMSPVFLPSPPHLLSVLGRNCWNSQQAIKLFNSLLLNLGNEQSYTRDMRIYKDESEAQILFNLFLETVHKMSPGCFYHL